MVARDEYNQESHLDPLEAGSKIAQRRKMVDFYLYRLFSAPVGVIIFIINRYQKGHFSKELSGRGFTNGPCKQFQVYGRTSVNFENCE